MQQLVSIPSLVGTALLVLVVSRTFSFWTRWRNVGYAKRLPCLFEPLGFPGAILPSTTWNPGLLFTWLSRHSLYRGNDAKTISVVPLLWGKPYLVSASMELMQQVTKNKAPFEKAEFGVAGQSLFGANNLVTSFQDDWPRHRRIAHPAFNQNLYHKVWTESVSIYHDMVASEGWDGQASISIQNVQPLVRKFTLHVLTAAGFGLPLPWQEREIAGDGMSLLEAYEIMAENIVLTIAAPSWAYHLPIKLLRQLKESRSKIISYMEGIIATRRAERAGRTEMEVKDESPNIFNMLLSANEKETGKAVLGDKEVMSNVFILLFAGHDTSAKTIGAALGLLACHPSVQEDVYQHIHTVLADGRDPTYTDFDALRPVQACLVEALRLFPVAPLLIREPLEDSVLRFGKDHSIAVSKGAVIICDIIGMNYSSEYYPDPNTFRPSRWMDKTELAIGNYLWGSGPRACIGAKFALLEMTCFLASFIRDWKVEPILAAGEDNEAWRKRVLEGSVALTITLGPIDIPLRLIRRY